MSNFNQQNSQSEQSASDEVKSCPALASINSMPLEQREEMLKMYESMLASGMHKQLDTVQSIKPAANSIGSMKQSQVFEDEEEEEEVYSSTGSSSNETSQAIAIHDQKAHQNMGMMKMMKKGPAMGCPFFSKEITDPQGKNITQGYPLKYISKQDYLFKPQGSSQKSKAPKQSPQSQEYLESLPFVIKNSLFIDNDIIKQLRELPDVGEVFFITDDTKIKGNRTYDLGKYYEALDIYEQVLSCYLWLEFKDEQFKETLFNEFSCRGISDEDVDMKERRIMRESDREIENSTNSSMVVGTLVNSMLAYMSMYHFEEASKCADFILDQYFQDPEIYFRKAQITYFNKTCSLQELSEASKMLKERCIDSDKQYKFIVKYKDLSAKIEKEVESRVQAQLKTISLILKRSKKLSDSAKLKINKDKPVISSLDDNEMYQVMKIMNQKYSEIVQFFRDSDNPVQMQKAVNEYQYFAKIYSDIEFVLDLNVEKLDEQIKNRLDQYDCAIIEDQSLRYAIDNVKLEIADSIFFHSSDLNQEVYNYSWKLYQERKEKLKLIEQKKGKYQKDLGNEKPRSLLEQIADPTSMTVMNIGIFLVFAIALFYFGYGLDWISERHITKWMRTIYRSGKKL